MSYRTCESAGEKAIGLEQDKRKNRGEEGLNKRTPKQNGCEPPPPPHPQKGLWRHMNPILLPLQPNWTNLLTHVFIYIKKANLEGETHTHAWNRSLGTSVTRASTGSSENYWLKDGRSEHNYSKPLSITKCWVWIDE